MWDSMIEGRRVRVEPVDDDLRPVARHRATMLQITFEDGETLYYSTGRSEIAAWTLRQVTPGDQTPSR